MTNEFVLEAITREFPDSVVSHSEPYGFLTLEIKKEDIKKVIHYLRDSSLEINFLTDNSNICTRLTRVFIDIGIPDIHRSGCF